MIAIILFRLECCGLLCDRPTVMAWLENDLDYVRHSQAALFFDLPRLAVWVAIDTPPTGHIHLKCFRHSDDAPPTSRDYALLQMVTQDLFCVLERRGFVVHYQSRTLPWQAQER